MHYALRSQMESALTGKTEVKKADTSAGFAALFKPPVQVAKAEAAPVQEPEHFFKGDSAYCSPEDKKKKLLAQKTEYMPSVRAWDMTPPPEKD